MTTRIHAADQTVSISVRISSIKELMRVQMLSILGIVAVEQTIIHVWLHLCLLARDDV